MHQITAGHPDVAEDTAAQAETLIALGRYEQALASIGRGLILAPTDTRLHCHRAVARLRLGRFREAARSAGEAISADPYEPWAYDLKASALSAQARTRLRPWRQQLGRQASDAAHRAVQLAPADARCQCTAAEAGLLSGNWPAARDAAQQALELAPDQPEPYVAVTLVALAARDFSTARAAARCALAIEPTSYAATNHLGSALVGLGRWKQAAGTYAAAARLDPDARPARRNLVRLGVSMLLPAVLAVMLLLFLVPYGLVISPLIGLTAGTAAAQIARFRRRLGQLGLMVAMGIARLDLRRGLMVAGAVVAAVAATTAAVTLAVGAGVAAAGLVVATGPVAVGFIGSRVAPVVRRRIGRSVLDPDLVRSLRDRDLQ